jgi:DNA mismatch repair ATPase MutS
MQKDHAQIDAEKTNDIFEPVIRTNDNKTFILLNGQKTPLKLSRKLYTQLCPLSVIDAETLKLIQVLRLHATIDHTVSTTGSAVLLRSLIQPSTDLVHIRSKQDALREIASNEKLRQALQNFVHEFSKGESALYKFFNKDLYALFPYRDVKKARQSAASMVKAMQTIPTAETSYLKGLLANLHLYKGSSIDRMMTGSIYRTFKGLKSDKEVGLFTPKQKFIPHRFSKWMAAGPAVALSPYIYTTMEIGPSLSPLMSILGLVWTGFYVFYSIVVKPVKDTGNFIEPFREKCVQDQAFSRAVDTVGMIDELLSCHSYAGQVPQATTLPTVTDDARHAFEATGLRNPILAKEKPECVPNDVRMNGTRLSFISGPNSGGKTTICKSIVQNQLLAQMGSYVLAEKATINIADMIRYQAPKFDGLQDDEGRFGTELSRTRDIFYATSPRSLVILDELAEGTTYEERLHESFEILSDFHTIGNNTVLVTHNHSLVDRFMAEKKGQCLMTAFNGDDPTYKIIPGISRVSHAGRITRKIKFSQEDRHRYMKEKGYL